MKKKLIEDEEGQLHRIMKRAIIIAKGKVQKVGYRDFAQDTARELSITGYVENLGDGDVKIVCEGKEADIKAFIENIKVKKGFIDVSETSVSYEEPTGELKVFKIKYGDVPEELGDRLGTAILYLSAMDQKIEAGFTMLGEKIDEGREENKQGFGTIAGKMDLMLEKQDLMLGKQDESIGAIREVSEKVDRGKEDIVTEIKLLRETFL